MVHFKSTTTPQSERLLAHTLGYPKSWHVVRISPHPSFPDKEHFQDTIYSGDPEIADRYFNHTAAMDAAMRWIEGESTKFDEDGGQLLRTEEEGTLDYLEEGDEVEVYYEKDRKWYHATIIEVIQYRDDVRFTVQYTHDDSTQTNVCLERIREIQTNKRKIAAASKKRKANVIEEEEEEEIEEEEESKPPPSKKAKTTPTKRKGKKSINTIGYVADLKELQLASNMGLPEGWAVNVKPNSRFTFYSPDGELKLKSKTAVFDHLGLPMPKHGLNSLDDDDYFEEEDENEEEAKDIDDEGNDSMPIEDGDPPWRTTNHKYLGRRVEYTFPDGIVGKGTCRGWIADIDVDKDDNPGFVSERTNKPACLFHVVMDLDCPVASQDFEEYEMEEILIDGE